MQNDYSYYTNSPKTNVISVCVFEGPKERRFVAKRLCVCEGDNGSCSCNIQ